MEIERIIQVLEAFMVLLLVLILNVFVVKYAVAASPSGSHASRITTYEGTKTCLQCHEREAMDVHSSVHYQWKGDTSDLIGNVPVIAGKYGGINDFCIYPDINWIGQLTNVDGETVDGGCAKCHAGLGEKPTVEASTAQLENIDCLVCHSTAYKRKVESLGSGYKFVPDTTNMSISILQAAQSVERPTKENCLNCHSKSGGGDNFKRGDIEEAHRNAAKEFDVHMASKDVGGAGLDCLDCHTTINHKISGRGVDLRPSEGLDPVSCTRCHSESPHKDSQINMHTAKVNCTVCHIPQFAKIAPTDMERDWSMPGEIDATKRIYDPHMVKRSNVTPEYHFFNGRSYIYNFGDQAVPDSSGRIVMAKPEGNRNEPEAKINAFKHHLGNQPIDPLTEQLLPLKIGIFFQTGDLDSAVKEGVKEVGWKDNGYQFAKTERYMGIFHEVAPKQNALTCNDCHGGTRIDFAALGYAPKNEYNGQPLCASCHKQKTGDFEKVHNKHVDDKKYDCGVCHDFSAAGNPETPAVPITGAIEANPSGAASAGNSVTFTVSMQPSGGAYEYRFYLSGPSTGDKWKTVKDYSSSNSWTWKTSSADVGSNRIVVWVRIKGSVSAWEIQTGTDYKVESSGSSIHANSVILTADKASPQSRGEQGDL